MIPSDSSSDDLVGRAHEVDVQPLYRQRGREAETVAEPAEIGRQHQLHAQSRQLGIGAGQRPTLPVTQIEHQDRLVDLHPFGTGPGELTQDRGIQAQHLVEEVERFDIAALGQAEPGHGAEQDGSRLIPLRLGLAIIVDDLGAVQGELLPGDEFGDHVVIVGVEPFGHLAGGQAAMIVGASVQRRGGAAGHREIGREIGLPIGRGVARGHGAEHDAGVEHMVVEREVVGRQPVGAERALPRPGGGAQAGRGLQQV